MARKKKAAKKAAPKAKRRATTSPRKPARPRKTARRGKTAPRKGARKPARNRRGAARKSGSARGPARSRKAAASRVAAGGASSLSPAGEVYGAESWKEEELSATELDAGSPELDEHEAEGPEVVEESDESEW